MGRPQTEITKEKIRQKRIAWLSNPENHPSYIDGRSLKKYYCKCKNEITWECALKGSGMCKSCSMKERLSNPENHPMFGKESYFSIYNKIRTDVKGPDNPNWIDGRSWLKYPQEFNEQLRLEIRVRDNYQCQGENCSMTEEEHLMVYGRVLHVHHIDYNKFNCKKDNLITTCCQCNIRANINRTYWQEFYKQKVIIK